MCWRSSSADTKVSGEGQAGGAPCARADSPSARGETGYSSSADRGPDRADTCLQPVEDPTPGGVGVPKEGC